MKKYINEDTSKLAIGLLLFIISLFTPNIISLFLIILAYIIVSYEVYIESFKSIKEGEIFNEFLLMILATLGAFYIGEYDEALMVMILYSFGEYLSDLAVDKSKDKITSLLDLRVDKVKLVNGKEKEIGKVKLGEEFIVIPGERIPLDGVIVEGETFLDTSALTGESVPRKASINDQVLSGCINKEGVITVKATSTESTTTTSRILKLIEEAEDSKGKSEKFITGFARIYTPIVVVCALLLIIVPSIITKDYNTWIYRGLVFLVTSCPCALVLSVPLGYFCGIGVSGKYGAIIKGGNIIDKLNEVDYVLLDKTGTITEGVFEVTKVKPNDIENDELLKYIASSEVNSTHPIAKAILNSYKEELFEIKDCKEISGRGISCKINNNKILVGNKRLLEEEQVEVPSNKEVGTVIFLSINNQYKGYVVISDKIKESNKDLSSLKQIINKDLVIVSGDSSKVVEDVAKKVGINSYYGEVLPEDKANIVKEHKESGTTLFVGDGINDAPSLKIADIGVSIGNIGSDAAIEASDIVLMNGDLKTIEKIIKISRTTKIRIKTSITLALLIKLIILVLSIFGLTTIWLAVFADVGVTILSVLYVLTISLERY